jgi:outer membrane biosynthesis protein TonB
LKVSVDSEEAEQPEEEPEEEPKEEPKEEPEETEEKPDSGEEPTTTNAVDSDKKESPSTDAKDSEAADDSQPSGLEKAFVTFPEKLIKLVEDPELEDAVRWNEKGDTFCLVPSKFIEKVLNHHFQGSKFESFTRYVWRM